MFSAHLTPPLLDVTVCRSGERALVTVRGEVDVSTEPQLRACLTRLPEVGCRRIVIDLAGLTFIGCSGLAALTHTATLARRAGGTVTLRHPSRMVVRLLDISRVTGLFGIEPVETTAA